MKKIIIVLFLALSFSCFGQSVNMTFNTVATIDKETSIVKTTKHQITKFVVTEKEVFVTGEFTSTKYQIYGTPKVQVIDGMEALVIKVDKRPLEGFILVKTPPLNGVYMIYKDIMVYYYNN